MVLTHLILMNFMTGASPVEAVVIANKIFGIRLSMSANEILLREEQPNIRLKQIASKIVFRD